MDKREKINKALLPISIVIASIILGGFYYAAGVSKHTPSGEQQKNGLIVDENIPIKTEPKLDIKEQKIITKALQDTMNAQRRSDILTILNSIYQYSIDNNGNPPNMDVGSNCAASVTDAYDLKNKLSPYLDSIPLDPVAGVSFVSSGYYVINNLATGRITVCAPSSDTTPILSVTR